MDDGGPFPGWLSSNGSDLDLNQPSLEETIALRIIGSASPSTHSEYVTFNLVIQPCTLTGCSSCITLSECRTCMEGFYL